MNTKLNRGGGARAGAMLLSLCFASACASDPPAAEPPSGRTAINRLIGDAACESDAQCGTLAVGAKACGGPEAYLAWSSARTDGPALRSAAAQQSAARRKEIAAHGEVSTCMMLADPGAYCAAASGVTSGMRGVCRLRPAGSNAPLAR